MKGTIARIVKEKSFGFIKGSDKIDYFVHSSALKNCKFNDLQIGQEVEFEASEGAKGPRAEDVYA